jgi:hypothetical protein
MTNEQFKSLRRGDVIRGCGSGTAFVVDAHYGDFVIAMKSMHVSNPSEWELCASKTKESQNTDNQQAQPEIVTYCDNKLCQKWDCGVCSIGKCPFVAT